jgi:hypothetical protein
MTSSETLAALGEDTLLVVRIYADLVFVYKVVNGFAQGSPGLATLLTLL